MKKSLTGLILCITMLASLVACGAKEAGNSDVTNTTPTAGVTAPAAITAPAAEEPEESEKQPEITEAPEVTKTPSSPKEVKASFEEGDITLKMDELSFVKAPRAEYTMQEDGSVDVRFKQKDNSEIRFLLPARIDLNECSGITVRMRADYDVKCMLLNNSVMWSKDCTAFYEEYACADGTVREYYFTPHKIDEVYGIGFAPAQEIEDYALYKATVYSVTFHAKKADGATENDSAETVVKPTESPKVTETVKPTESPKVTEEAKPTPTPKVSYPKADVTKGDICYSINELKVMFSEGVKYTEKAGSMKLQFDKSYGQIRFLLPAAIDTSQCTGISIKMKTEDIWLCISCYDDRFIEHPAEDKTELWYQHVEMKGEVEEQGFNVADIGDIYGIAITYYGDGNATEAYEAVIENITFYMLSGNDVSIPYDIAPDVTEDMTLLNTYGTVIDKIGTCAFVAELQNPTVVQELKKHYNSITCCEGTFFDMFVMGPEERVTLEEAQKLGYVIPENYKEKMVPKLNFERLDGTLKVCAENGFLFRFHHLLWHDTDNNWFFRTDYDTDGKPVRTEVMDARLEFFIRNVMEHVYSGEYGHIVYAWDIMNEYLNGSVPESNWVKVYGDQGLEPEYLKLAYTVADDVLKKYGIRDKVALVFNEYNTYLIYHSGRDMTQDILSVLEYINSDGMVCDTIGMQSHLDTEVPIKGKWKKAIKSFFDAGYAVQFTETDVNVKTPAIGKEEQEKYYCEFMELVLEFARKGENITGLTFWGAGDTIAWLKWYSPLLFTHVGRPKDAYYKVLQTYLDPERIPETETVDITYGCDELQYRLSYVGDYIINQDGSMDIWFQDQYQEIHFILPEAIDMRHCVGITIKAKSEYSELAVKLYGEEWLSNTVCNPVYQYSGCLGEGVLDYDKLLEKEETVYGIGFMSLHNVEDFSQYKATVYSVTFHMEPGYKK